MSDAQGVTRFAPDGRPDRVRRLVSFPPGAVAGAIAVLPDANESEETLVVAQGATLRRFSLEGKPVPWAHQTAVLPLERPTPLELLDVLLRPDQANANALNVVNPVATGEVTALAAWEGKLWIGLSNQDDGKGCSSLYSLDLLTLHLASVKSGLASHGCVGGLAVVGSDVKPVWAQLAGRLLVHDPRHAEVVALVAGAARQVQGALLAGPFEDSSLGRWYRLSAPGSLPGNARFRFLTCTTDPMAQGSPSRLADLLRQFPPPNPEWYLAKGPPTDDGDSNSATGQAANNPLSSPADTAPPGVADPPDAPFWTQPDTWREAPDDLLDTRIWHEPANPWKLPFAPYRLWVAAFFRGDGTVTPSLGPLTAEAGHQGWESDLPAIYQRDSLNTAFSRGDSSVLPPPTLLDGLLGLFEAADDEIDDEIKDLARWFDPGLTRDPSALARHLGIDPDGLAPDQLQRALESFAELARLRGTAEGLASAIETETGITARLVEPIQTASLWVLGSTGSLGALTSLAPGPTQGAILDQTATLDQARLTGADDQGASLWDDVVGRVIVNVYAAQVSSSHQMRALKRCLSARAPAHVDYTVQVIDARARVGYQATLGLDAVLARANEGTRPLALGDALGPDHPLESPRVPRSAGEKLLGQDTLSIDRTITRAVRPAPDPNRSEPPETPDRRDP